MASSTKRRRRKSMNFPPSFSELMNKLIKGADSFIRLFDTNEDRMREIVGEFQKIVDKVKQMQKETDTIRTAGAATAGIGLTGLTGLAVAAAPFTGGLTLLLGPAVVTAVTAITIGAAAGGVTAVVAANISKVITEDGSAKKVEELGKDFMKIVEPMKNELEEIKTLCEKLEQKSAEAQAENSLSDMEELEETLRRVSELGRRVVEAEGVIVAVTNKIGELVTLVVKVFRVTANPEEDKKLRDSIIQSADQGQRVVDEFDKMKTELCDFTGK